MLLLQDLLSDWHICRPGFPGGTGGKGHLPMQETRVSIPRLGIGNDNSLSILTPKIPWTEDPAWLILAWVAKRVRHD